MIFEEERLELGGREIVLRSPKEEEAQMLLDYLKTVTGETRFLMCESDEVTYSAENELEFLKSHNESENEMMIMAFVDGEYAGNCAFEKVTTSRRNHHRASVGIALFLKYTGFGLGRLLMERLLAKIDEAGYEASELTVVGGNERAYHLYESLGFKECGRIPNANKYDDGTYADDILMVRKRPVTADAFGAFVKDIQENHWNVFGVEVYENGELTHSYGDTQENLHELYSATKTVLSVAAGMVYDMGLIDLDQCILEYLPKEKVDKMSAKQKETFRPITVKRLLTMSVGDIPFRAEGESWIDFALSCEISHPEERTFNYSNINSYLVGVALTEILGRDLGEFIEERIFQPLGITRFEYTRCPEGYFYGASGMKLTVHDFSKIGLLLYNKGMHQGQRLLSEKYDELATSVQMQNREGGYGYFVWKYLDGFSINGRQKQK